MLIKFLIGAAAILVGFLIVVALQPSTYRVERSLSLDASPMEVFSHVNDLHKWRAWSPWENVDPGLKRTYEGPEAGVGASYFWEGNREVGSGRMTIVESQPGERVGLQLEFYKPMAGSALAHFTFRPEGGRTLTTWTMTGESNFVGKAIGLFMSMDKMIGTQFEQGLTDLGKVVGTRPES